jgi:hypothetical protein
MRHPVRRFEMKRAFLGTLVFGAALAVASPIFAHHSISAEFDTTKPITFMGAVKQIDFGNPHIYTYVETKDEAGKAVVYAVEGGSPNDLARNGFTKTSLKIGEMVNVKGIRAKNPTSMRIGQAQITRLDGSRVF